MKNGLASIVGVIFVAITLFQISDNPIHLPLIFAQADAGVTDELYKGYIEMCLTTHRYTWVESLGVSGFKIVHSDSPDGSILPDGYPYDGVTEIGKGAIEGNWWVWLVDTNEMRVSESVPVHTDKDLGLYKCQHVKVVFYKESEIAP
jgi:hypothetical protein